MQFFKNSNVCYFDDNKKKMCYQTDCDNFYPQKSGWTVYGCSWCPYREKAVKLLNSKNISYHYYDVEQAPFGSREKYKKIMGSYIGNHLTTPAIFKDGKLIGGYTDLSFFLK